VVSASKDLIVAVVLFVFYFFFQAEDGIRDRNVTGVQTCALPISLRIPASVAWFFPPAALCRRKKPSNRSRNAQSPRLLRVADLRSEERRVGKECRARRGR